MISPCSSTGRGRCTKPPGGVGRPHTMMSSPGMPRSTRLVRKAAGPTPTRHAPGGAGRGRTTTLGRPDRHVHRIRFPYQGALGPGLRRKSKLGCGRPPEHRGKGIAGRGRATHEVREAVAEPCGAVGSSLTSRGRLEPRQWETMPPGCGRRLRPVDYGVWEPAPRGVSGRLTCQESC